MPKVKTAINNKTKETNLEIKTGLYDLSGKEVNRINLPPEIFGVKASPVLLAQAVRVYLNNQRLGTHSTKTRSMVTGSTRKIYKQKGTGRARHGDIKAPIFVGGGVAHGPHPIDYSQTMPANMRKKALFSILTQKLQSGNLKVVAGFAEVTGKTKEVVLALKSLLENNDKKNNRILLVTPKKVNNLFLAGRNIKELTIREANLINVYEIMLNKKILLMKEAIEVLKNTFLKKDDVKKEKVEVKEKTIEKKVVAKIKKETKTRVVIKKAQLPKNQLKNNYLK